MERGCLTSHCLRVAPLGKSRFLLNVVMAELVRYLDVGRRRGETESLFFFWGGGRSATLVCADLGAWKGASRACVILLMISIVLHPISSFIFRFSSSSVAFFVFIDFQSFVVARMYAEFIVDTAIRCGCCVLVVMDVVLVCK